LPSLSKLPQDEVSGAAAFGLVDFMEALFGVPLSVVELQVGAAPTGEWGAGLIGAVVAGGIGQVWPPQGLQPEPTIIETPTHHTTATGTLTLTIRTGVIRTTITDPAIATTDRASNKDANCALRIPNPEHKTRATAVKDDRMDGCNILRFPTTKFVFLDKAERQRVATLAVDDRNLYDPALGRQKEQAAGLMRNRIEPSNK
jgi:hypothetical protein